MKDRILERFLRYVKIYTPSDEACEDTPSSKCQFDLANELVREMKEMGISDACVDEHCYVYGTVPASEGAENAPAIAFIAHMDTVSDFCDKPVIPVVHENYDGGDIYLEAGDRTIKISDFPHLAKMAGRSIITSDGTTILGADDKAGIAEIMTMAEELLASEKPHGKVCMAFTPDEEIGSGAHLLDLEKLGADFAFTMDGDIEGGIEYETFNAAAAKVTIKGVNVHPGSAKDIMVNAGVLACEFNSLLPEKDQPRNTSGYEGFFHLVDIKGDVSGAVLTYIIRDHDRVIFEQRKAKLFELADILNRKYGEGTVTVEEKDSYYNMADVLKDRMDIVEAAKEAVKMEGLEPDVKPVRGGTDGSALSFRGLPCPNLATGGAGYHGPYEHISLEGMEVSTKVMLNIIGIYSR